MFSENLSPGQKKWLAEMLLCHTAEHDPQNFDDVYNKVGVYIDLPANWERAGAVYGSLALKAPIFLSFRAEIKLLI